MNIENTVIAVLILVALILFLIILAGWTVYIMVRYSKVDGVAYIKKSALLEAEVGKLNKENQKITNEYNVLKANSLREEKEK